MWPVASVVLVMLFGGPDATESRSNVLFGLMIFTFPLSLFALLWVFDVAFWGITASVPLLVFTIPVIIALRLFNYPNLLMKVIRKPKTDNSP